MCNSDMTVNLFEMVVLMTYFLSDLATTSMSQDEIPADFEGGDSGASQVFPAQCSSLRKNGHVVIKVS